MSQTSDKLHYYQRSGASAENMFEEYAKAKRMSFERYGFDGSNIRPFIALPIFIRKTPDYAAVHNKQGFLVECKAGGRGAYFNLKKEDYTTLATWNDMTDVRIFFNDSLKKKVALIPVSDIEKVFVNMSDDVIEGTWDDNVQYFAFPKKYFEWENYSEFR